VRPRLKKNAILVDTSALICLAKADAFREAHVSPGCAWSTRRSAISSAVCLRSFALLASAFVFSFE
jgi:hypothetical protein